MIQMVADHLPLDDIFNLRLTSRTLAARSMGSKFLNRVRRMKEIDLLPGPLRDFSERITHLSGAVAAAVQDICIVGIAKQGELRWPPHLPRPPDDDASDGHAKEAGTDGSGTADTSIGAGATEDAWAEELELLTQLFNQLAQCRDDEPLESLTLRVCVILSPSGERTVPVKEANHCFGRAAPCSKSVWQCTVYSFLTTMRALAASSLRIRRLNMFNQDDMQMCGLPRRQLNRVDWGVGGGLAESLEPLTALSLSICTPLYLDIGTFRGKTPEPGPDENGQRVWRPPPQETSGIDTDNGWDLVPGTRDELDQVASDELEISGVAKIIALCKHLDDLDLRYVRINSNRRHHTIGFGSERILQSVLASIKSSGGPCPRLKRLRLGGLSMWHDDLIEFLKTTGVGELSLLSTFLFKTGHVKDVVRRPPLLDYLSSAEARLTYLHLDNIWYSGSPGSKPGNRLCFLNDAGGPRTETSALDTRTYERRGDGVREDIVLMEGRQRRPPGSGYYMRWCQARLTRYGWAL